MVALRVRRRGTGQDCGDLASEGSAGVGKREPMPVAVVPTNLARSLAESGAGLDSRSSRDGLLDGLLSGLSGRRSKGPDPGQASGARNFLVPHAGSRRHHLGDWGVGAVDDLVPARWDSHYDVGVRSGQQQWRAGRIFPLLPAQPASSAEVVNAAQTTLA